VPVTTAGRLVAAVVMIAGVAALGEVAAGVALIVARAVAMAEEESSKWKRIPSSAASSNASVGSRRDWLGSRRKLRSLGR